METNGSGTQGNPLITLSDVPMRNGNLIMSCPCLSSGGPFGCPYEEWKHGATSSMRSFAWSFGCPYEEWKPLALSLPIDTVSAFGCPYEEWKQPYLFPVDVWEGPFGCPYEEWKQVPEYHNLLHAPAFGCPYEEWKRPSRSPRTSPIFSLSDVPMRNGNTVPFGAWYSYR